MAVVKTDNSYVITSLCGTEQVSDIRDLDILPDQRESALWQQVNAEKELFSDVEKIINGGVAESEAIHDSFNPFGYMRSAAKPAQFPLYLGPNNVYALQFVLENRNRLDKVEQLLKSGKIDEAANEYAEYHKTGDRETLLDAAHKFAPYLASLSKITVAEKISEEVGIIILSSVVGNVAGVAAGLTKLGSIPKYAKIVKSGATALGFSEAFRSFHGKPIYHTQKSFAENTFDHAKDFLSAAIMFKVIGATQQLFMKTLYEFNYLPLAMKNLIDAGVTPTGDLIRAEVDAVRSALVTKISERLGSFTAETGAFTALEFAETYAGNVAERTKDAYRAGVWDVAKILSPVTAAEATLSPEAFFYRVIFLGALKVGNFFARPIVEPIEERVSEAVMERQAARSEREKSSWLEFFPPPDATNEPSVVLNSGFPLDAVVSGVRHLLGLGKKSGSTKTPVARQEEALPISEKPLVTISEEQPPMVAEERPVDREDALPTERVDLRSFWDRAVPSEEAQTFRDYVNSALESAGVADFITGIRNVLATSAASVKGVAVAADSLGEEFMSEEIGGISGKGASGNLRKGSREGFRLWAEGELERHDSWLSAVARAWIHRERVAIAVEENSSMFDALRESLEGLKLTSALRSRVEGILKQLHSLQVNDFPLDDVLGEYARSVYSQQQSSAKTGPAANGAAGRNGNGFSGVVNGLLDPSYGNAAKWGDGGLTNEGYISANFAPRARGDAGANRSDTLGNRLNLLSSELQGKALGAEDAAGEVEATGLDEFVQANGLGEAYRQVALNVMRPLLGRPDLVEDVTFHPETSRDGTLGTFSKGQMNLYSYPAPFRGLEKLFLKTVAHETGHSMRPSALLPLDMAIVFEVAMAASEAISGNISRYSEQAQTMYAERAGRNPEITALNQLLYGAPVSRQAGGSDNGENFILDSRLEEEWAEMLGFAAVASETFTRLFPSKAEIVGAVTKAFGIDFSALSSGVEKALGESGNPAANQFSLLLLVDAIPEWTRYKIIGRLSPWMLPQ